MFASVDIFANGKQCAMNCSQTMFANNIRWVHALKNGSQIRSRHFKNWYLFFTSKENVE